MQQIYPGPAQLDDDALVEAYAYPDRDGRRHVRANMVISLDGSAQGPDGRSGSLSSAADKRVFSLLRGLADVILVGASTARVESYGKADPHPDLTGLRARLGQHPAPPIAVVSNGLDLEPDGPLFTGSGEPTLVLTSGNAPDARRQALAAVTDVVVVGSRQVDLAQALAELERRGLTRVLCEGGPHLLGHLTTDGLLDDLCLTVSPRLRGGDAFRALEGPRVTDGSMKLVHVLEEDGTLLTRWLRPGAGTG